MSSQDLITFVRARISTAESTTGRTAETEAYRKIVDEFESADAQASFPNYDGGYASGLEDAVTILAGIWSHHPDWRENWWT